MEEVNMRGKTRLATTVGLLVVDYICLIVAYLLALNVLGYQ